MNLYRLDFEDPDGSTYPVQDFFGTVLIPRSATARQRAINAACEAGKPVLITRISGAGYMRRMLRANPDASVSRIRA